MDNLRAILLMVAGMAAFAVGDLALKIASREVALPLIIFVQAVGGVLIFLPLALRRREAIVSPAMVSPPVLIRIGGEIMAVVGMTTGLSMSDLATASALMQLQPLVVMLGAVLFLGETVGWRRWLAVGLGFGGVLVITRPAGGIEPGLLWILFGVAGLAARDVATRRVDPSTSSVLLSVWSFAGVLPVSVTWLAISGGAAWPGPGNAALLVVMALSVALAFFLVTSSLRVGEVSAVIPFRYSRLLFALILAIAVLGERPDIWVFAGALLIVGSGLYAVLRERALARSRARIAAAEAIR